MINWLIKSILISVLYRIVFKVINRLVLAAIVATPFVWPQVQAKMHQIAIATFGEHSSPAKPDMRQKTWTKASHE